MSQSSQIPLSKPNNTAGKGKQALSLHAFLNRLIWICVLPLLLLAVYLAGNYIHTLQTQRDQQAVNQVLNVADALDRNLQSRIAALQVLAASPFVDDPPRMKELYREAQGYRESFDAHVIFADLSMQMIFNTRVPFGATLPKLPQPEGNVVPSVLATGKPAVGDMFIGPVADIVRQHRECFDGSGFPQGIKGEDILIEARILAVADAIEDLTSHRSYRNPFPLSEALEEVSSHSGLKYDPDVVAACMRLFKEKGYKIQD